MDLIRQPEFRDWGGVSRGAVEQPVSSQKRQGWVTGMEARSYELRSTVAVRAVASACGARDPVAEDTQRRLGFRLITASGQIRRTHLRLKDVQREYRGEPDFCPIWPRRVIQGRVLRRNPHNGLRKVARNGFQD